MSQSPNSNPQPSTQNNNNINDNSRRNMCCTVCATRLDGPTPVETIVHRPQEIHSEIVSIHIEAAIAAEEKEEADTDNCSDGNDDDDEHERVASENGIATQHSNEDDDASGSRSNIGGDDGNDKTERQDQESSSPGKSTSAAAAAAAAATSTRSPPYIALSCTGKCRRDNHKKTESTKSSSLDAQQHQSLHYYCLPDCWEHFLNHNWGIYSGLGSAHKGFSSPGGLLAGACETCRSDLEVVVVETTTSVPNDSNGSDNNNTMVETTTSKTLEEALVMVSPKLLSKAFAIFHDSTTLPSASNPTIRDGDAYIPHSQNNDGNNNNNSSMSEEEKEIAAIIRRITQELEEIRLLKCPSCHFKIAVPEDRGCDAGWCEHCGRALCLYCLTDCGDHPKTDPTANGSNHLIGDAHDHVINNDCGLTAGKGHIHSGKNLVRYHERQFLKQVALRLKRVPETIRDAVCGRLVIPPESLDSMVASNVGDQKEHSLTELRREMENDKWEQYPNDLRVRYLHAAYQGDLPMVRCLLATGIPHNIPDSVGGQTALHFASVKGHAEVVQYLLEHAGANPWQLSPQSRTSLDDLCNVQSSCDLTTARYLILHCMLSVPALFHAQKVVYPWLRPWPNGTTALACAEENHKDSPVSSYFSALQDSSYRLCKASATGQTKAVKRLLANRSDIFPIPRPNEERTHLQLLPPARDLVWVYNAGSGCTPLIDLCARSLKLSPQHILETAKMILDAAKLHDSTNSTASVVERFLQMRDCKFNATALHWLARDHRPQVLKTAGLFLQSAGNPLAQAIDRRGQTALDWARNFSIMPENPAEEEDDVDRQRHIGRWEVLMLAWEEEP